MRTRLSFLVGPAVALAVAPAVAVAQPTAAPLVSVGAAIAISCPGSYDGIPTLELDCDERREGAPGPYVRPYVSFRPADRLLVTATVGYVRMPDAETGVYDDGIRPPVTLVVAERTAWHVHATAAYVGGEPTHPVRAFVGGGLVYFRDPARQVLRGSVPAGVVAFVDEKRSAIDGVFTTGLLIRGRGPLAGRVSYTLAEQLATTTVSDGGWRHEIGFGLEWAVKRR